MLKIFVILSILISFHGAGASEDDAPSDEIIQAIYPDFNPATKTIEGGAKKLSGAEAKIFPNDKNKTAVMICFTKNGKDPESEFAVVATGTRPPKLVAKTEMLGYFHKTGVLFDPETFHFDFARYNINEHERAFGYRFETDDGSGSGNKTTETILRLYRLTPAGLEMVFDQTTDIEIVGIDEGETHSEVSVLKTKTGGNFDWTLGKNTWVWNGWKYCDQKLIKSRFCTEK